MNIDFENLRRKILELLNTSLPGNVYYHSAEHTADVIEAAERIAMQEQVNGPDLVTLKVAALFHDTGYTVDYLNHERHSCNIARRELMALNVNTEDINRVSGIIMATEMPQKPGDVLAEILCDADLDYLGRDDFFKISHNLFRELQAYGRVQDEKEWNRMQLVFLSTHNYFTKSSKQLRQAGKEKHHRMILNIVANY